MRYIIVMACIMPTVLFGADDTPKDIIPRALNFLLFAALLYYFVAGPLKTFFRNRVDGIANELDKVQTKLRDSKAALDAAQKRVQSAKQEAESIVETAKREAVILKQKIAEAAERDIEVLQKQFDDSLDFERRRAEQAVIGAVLDELFGSDAIRLDKAAYTDILLKKVA